MSHYAEKFSRMSQLQGQRQDARHSIFFGIVAIELLRNAIWQVERVLKLELSQLNILSALAEAR